MSGHPRCALEFDTVRRSEDLVSSCSVFALPIKRYKLKTFLKSLNTLIPILSSLSSGSVVTLECVEKFLRKDMIDPINGKQMKDSDIIPLLRGGTGFAQSNVLTAEVKRPVMQA